jgi:hypothetical protein
MMTRTILLAIAFVVVFVDGLVYGLWTDRWGNGQAVDEAVGRLERVPLTIGDWQGQARLEGSREAEQAGFSGFCLRRYERPRDGMVVEVMLACGRPGPLCVHPPSVCYAGAGFVQAEAAVKHVAFAAADTPAEFWKSRFTKSDSAIPMNLRIFWSWRTLTSWKAAHNPRWEFAAEPVLFKMYVTHVLTGADDRREDSACAEFLDLLLPEIEKAVAGPP